MGAGEWTQPVMLRLADHRGLHAKETGRGGERDRILTTESEIQLCAGTRYESSGENSGLLREGDLDIVGIY